MLKIAKFLKSAFVATVILTTLAGCDPNGTILGWSVPPTPTPSPTPAPTPSPSPTPTPTPTPTFAPLFTTNEMESIVAMLDSGLSTESTGLSYVGSAESGGISVESKVLPMSFYATESYFGAYVCGVFETQPTDCDVTDIYYDIDGHSTFVPESHPQTPGDLQIERTIASYGTDIYDAATWQIALALAEESGVIGSGTHLPDNQTTLLNARFYGNGNYYGATPNVGDIQTNTGSFTYNGTVGGNIVESYSYSYRILPRSWISPDPFRNTIYQESYVTSDIASILVDWLVPSFESSPGQPGESTGYTTWDDWNPITGENAWGFLTGPLQADYMRYNGNIPADAVSVQNAINVLTTFQIMQSQIGAIYYAPAGAAGNTGAGVNRYTVSIENNASTLAGLLILEKILQAENNPSATAILAESNIYAMIHGGTVNIENGLTTGPESYATAGILGFFESYAFEESQGIFWQEGHANDPNYAESWAPAVDPNGGINTVDVNTWTVAVLGVPFVDGTFGPGTAYNIWQHVKQFAGYCGTNNTLWGVGYSAADGNNGESNGVCSAQASGTGILSGEWTAGAINMVRVLIYQYSQESGESAQQYVASLESDLTTMQAGVMNLRTDTYPALASSFTGQQHGITDYNSLVQVGSNQLAFMYASKRYYIPFGWYANPLPSTASTSWMVMLNYSFNPFRLGGNYSPNFSESGAEE